jgi:hypothetical protein
MLEVTMSESKVTELKQEAVEQLENVKAEATAAAEQVSEKVQEGVAELKSEVDTRVAAAKQHLETTKASVAELYSTLKAELTTTLNALFADAQGAFAEVKAIVTKTSDAALVKLEGSKKVTVEALQKFKV